MNRGGRNVCACTGRLGSWQWQEKSKEGILHKASGRVEEAGFSWLAGISMGY